MKSLAHKIVLQSIDLYNLFILKCVSIMNISINNYVKDCIDWLQRLPWVVFQFFIQKYTWQNNTISIKETPCERVTLNEVLNNYGLTKKH